MSRVAELERRVAELEARLGAARAGTDVSPHGIATLDAGTAPRELARDGAEARPAHAAPIAPVPMAPTAAAGAPTSPSAAPIAPIRVAPAIPSLVVPYDAPATPGAAPPRAAPIMLASPAPDEPSLVATTARLEIIVGGRWFAWIGTIIFAIAAAYFLKLAHDKGWIGRMPPLLRCLAAAGFGALLIAGGEVALRRINRFAAVGLFASGLATLYITAFAAHRAFGLVGDGGAMAMLALTALLGMAITVRGRMVSIGVLSLLAGYASPLLLRSQHASPVALPLHLTMLLAVALGLALRWPKPFRWLRPVALPMHAVVATLWMSARPETILLTVFALGWWIMTMLESLWAARRGHSRIANAVIAFLSTSWLATVLVIFVHAGADAGWVGAILVVVATAAVAMLATAGDAIAPLRRRSTAAFDLFAVAVWLASGLLLVAAAAVQFQHVGLALTWLAIALAGIEAGRRLPSRGVELFGVGVLLLAIATIVLVDTSVTALQATLLAVPAAGVQVSKVAGLVLLAAAASVLAAWRLRSGARTRGAIPTALTVIASLLLLGEIAASARGVAGTVGWLLVAAALLGTHRVAARQRHFEIGAVVTLGAALRWLMLDLASATDRSGPATMNLAPWFNAQMAVAVPVAAMVAWACMIATRQAGDRDGDLRRRGFAAFIEGVAPALAVMVMLAAFSVEIVRATGPVAPGPWSLGTRRFLWWSALWAGGGTLMVAIGAARSLRPTWAAGIVATIVAALAWLLPGAIIDRFVHGLANVAPMVNLQTLAAAVVCAACVACAAGGPWLRPGVRGWRAAGADAMDATAIEPPFTTAVRGVLSTLAAIVVLVAGSLESERIVGAGGETPFTTPAVSVWWGLCGVTMVIGGFWLGTRPPGRTPSRRAAASIRHGGLALLVATVAKFLVVDLRGAETVWRVAAMAVVGLLLVGTSVMYAKIGSRLFAPSDR
ncbi:MAG: DUF2339 domain-containing protein [Phycisphaerales bacterium]